jgi:hypothetical protein
VVVDVAEVALRLHRHPWELGQPDPREQIPLGRDRLAQAHQAPLHFEDALKLLVGRALEERVLDLVDLVVELGQDWEEAVDQGVHDVVQDERGLLRLAPPRLALAQRREGRAVVAVDGDQEALGVEAVHLHQAVLVGRRPVDDQEDVVVVGLELGALAEALGVLQRQRVEPEQVPQEGELLGGRPVEVQPKEPPLAQAALDLRPVGRDRTGPRHQVAGQRAPPLGRVPIPPSRAQAPTPDHQAPS